MSSITPSTVISALAFFNTSTIDLLNWYKNPLIVLSACLFITFHFFFIARAACA